MSEKRISMVVEGSEIRISGLFLRPSKAHCVLVFGHGAGAGMMHPFMSSVARKLAERGVATLRYHFPYMEIGGKRPDPKPVLLATVRTAVSGARALEKKLPLFVGGKSMGGRMSSAAMAQDPSADVQGIVFFGFPLHTPGVPSDGRAEHLYQVAVPMLFLQGTRDKLADLKLLEPVVEKLGNLATLHIIEGADHSFRVPKSLGKSDDVVHDNLSEITWRWMSRVMP